MEGGRRRRHSSPGGGKQFLELDTKGCCVLCFKPAIPLEGGKPHQVTVRGVYPFEKLCGYLRLDIGVLLRRLIQEPSPSTSGYIGYKPRTTLLRLKVTLCRECGRATSNFSALCKHLDKFQPQMENCLRLIQNRIAEAEGDANRVKHFFRLMTCDQESRTCLEVVDELRSRIFIKCFQERVPGTDQSNLDDENSEGPLDDLLECLSMRSGRSRFYNPRREEGTRTKPNPNSNQGKDRSQDQDRLSYSKEAYPDLDISECNQKKDPPAGVGQGRKMNSSSSKSRTPAVPFIKLSSSSDSDDEIGDQDYDALDQIPDPVKLTGNHLPELPTSTSTAKSPGHNHTALNQIPDLIKLPAKHMPTSTFPAVKSPGPSTGAAGVTYNITRSGERHLEVHVSPNEATTSPGPDDIPEPEVSPAPVDSGIEETLYRINPLTGKYGCPSCKKMFNTRAGISKHYESVHLHLRHKCGRCNKDFHSRASYTRHFKMAHLNVRYKCEECNTVFTLLTNLRQHQRMNKCFSVGGRKKKGITITNANGEVL